MQNASRFLSHLTVAFSIAATVVVVVYSSLAQIVNTQINNKRAYWRIHLNNLI